MNRPRLIALMLALITLMLYLPTAWHDFIVYDDGDYVSQNRVVNAGLTWGGFQWAFNSWHSSNWHPLTWLSHMLDCELFGLNPGAHHLVNVMFHVANAVLLFVLLLRLTNALWPAAIVAALFAWHPLHVESVAWIAERKDVLNTFFGFLSLLAYVRYVREKRRGSFWLSIILFACALMSKPMLVTLPFVMLLLDFWPLRRITHHISRVDLFRLILEKIPFFLLTFASCVVTYFAQRAHSVVSLEHFPLSLRIGNAILSYGRYLWKAFFPADLAIIYPLSPQLPLVWVAITAVLLIVVSIGVWLKRRNQPFLLVGWFWFLGTLVPVIGLVQVGRAAMADRYSYVPLIGVFIAVVYGIQNLKARFDIKPASLGVITGLVLAACLALTERQLTFWENDEALFGHAISVTQDNSIAQINYGHALDKAGREVEAQSHYREALRIDPGSVEAHVNIAIFLDKEGKNDEAMFHYREALRLQPDSPLANMNLGGLLVKLGRFDEAMEHYEGAAKFDSADPRPHYLMGKARLRQGRSAEAVAQFREALKLDATDLQSLIWLARVLAADENADVRNGSQAVELVERANELTGGRELFVLDVLAMAYAEAGRFDDAVAATEIEIKLATAAEENDLIAEIRERLKLYQERKPYRESFVLPTN